MAVENIHSNIKKSKKFTFYRPYYDVIKNIPIFFMNQQYKFSSFV